MDVKTHNEATRRTAKLLAANDIYVFAVSQSKKPFKGSHGYKDATVAADEIDRMWDLYAKDENGKDRLVNVAIDCWRSGIVVLDFDNKKGEGELQTGMDILRLLEAQYPDATRDAVRQWTGSRGQHLIFRAPDGLAVKSTSSNIKFMPHVDTRAHGGFIVIVPSGNEDGYYEYVGDRTLENTPVRDLPVLPDYWVEQLRKYRLIKNLVDEKLNDVRKAWKNPESYTIEDVRYSANHFLELYVSQHSTGSRHDGGMYLAKQLLLYVHKASPPLPESEALGIMREYARRMPQNYRKKNGQTDKYTEEEAEQTYRSMRPDGDEPIILLASMGDTPLFSGPPVEPIVAAPENITKMAMDLLEHGDPIKYWIETFNMRHVGDEKIALAGLACFAAQCVLKTSGLQLLIHGKSQVGKTHAAKTLVDMAPHGYVYKGSMSNKFLHYMSEGGQLRTGTTVFMDDKAIFNPELEEMMKTAISAYTERYQHGTVLDKQGKILHLPARLFWVMTSATAHFADEVYNRFISIGADDSVEQDERVNEMQREKHFVVEEAVYDGDRFEVCREMLRILKDSGPVEDSNGDHHYYNVVIPYTYLISWEREAAIKHNLFDIFCDLVKAFALLRAMQRPRLPDRRKTVVATPDDYNEAMKLWYEIGGPLLTHLTAEEERVANVIRDKGKVKQTDLQLVYNQTYPHDPLSQPKLSKLLNGKTQPGGEQVGGILDKVPFISIEKGTDDVLMADGRTSRRSVIYYVWDNEGAKERYMKKRDMVSMEMHSVATSIVECIKLGGGDDFVLKDKRIEPHVKTIARYFLGQSKNGEHKKANAELCKILGIRMLVDDAAPTGGDRKDDDGPGTGPGAAGERLRRLVGEEDEPKPEKPAKAKGKARNARLDLEASKEPAYAAPQAYEPKATEETRLMVLRTFLNQNRWILELKKPNGELSAGRAETLANKFCQAGLYNGKDDRTGRLLKDAGELIRRIDREMGKSG